MRWWWGPLCSSALAHWNNSPRIDMSRHSDTLFWFRANQSLPLLLYARCLAEKQQIPILYFLVWPDRGSNTRSTALEANTLTITPPMRFTLNYAGSIRKQWEILRCVINVYVTTIHKNTEKYKVSYWGRLTVFNNGQVPPLHWKWIFRKHLFHEW